MKHERKACIHVSESRGGEHNKYDLRLKLSGLSTSLESGVWTQDLEGFRDLEDLATVMLHPKEQRRKYSAAVLIVYFTLVSFSGAHTAKQAHDARLFGQRVNNVFIIRS